MKLVKTKNILKENIDGKEFDLIITASGFESRAKHLAATLNMASDNKYVIGFKEHKETAVRKKNDETFKGLNYVSLEQSGNEASVLHNLLLKFLSQHDKKEEVNILVDYSSMSRVWYAEIIRILRDSEPMIGLVNVYFCYSFSQYVDPPMEMIYNRHVGPINGFYSITVPSKPSALVIGLGYIESRAFGLAEYFDVDPMLFIASSPDRPEFFEKVVQNNDRLISQVEVKNIYYYPVNNLVYTETLLYHLCRDLQPQFRVIIAPCGPKTFTLLSLLISLRIPELDVWRISAGENDLPVDKAPSGEINIFCVSFGKSDLIL